MDELTLTLLSRTRDGAETRAERRVVLFERPERYAVATAEAAGPIAALDVRFPRGADVLLSGLVLRDGEGRDLYRWAGAGELFRQMHGLRLSAHDGAVRLEALEDQGGFQITVDEAVTDRRLEVLLTLASTARLQALAPDQVTLALEQLQARVSDLDAAEGERNAALEAQAKAQAAEALAQYAEARKQFAEAQTHYQALRDQFDEAQRQYDEVRKFIAEGSVQFTEATRQFAEAQRHYDEARKFIAEGSVQFAEARAQFGEAQTQYAEAQKLNRETGKQLAGFTKRLTSVDAQLGGVNESLGGFNERLGGVDAQLGGVNERLGGVDAQLAQLAQLTGHHDVLIGHVDRRTAETQEVVKQALASFRAETHQLHQHVLAQLQQDQARAVQVEHQLAIARELASEQAKRISALETSTSWKITAPLRVLIRLATGKLTLGGVMHRLRHPPRAQPPAPAPVEPPPPAADPIDRPPPRAVAFPQPGAVATLGELLETPGKPLPLKVSVIIPTFNAGHEFHWLLRKLQGQKGLAGVEVVVVDSGSSDGTDTLAEKFGCTVVRIPNSEFSHSHARNLGADNASGDLYLFTVQDAYPVGDWWLHSLALALTEPASEEERAAAVSCSEFPRVDSELLYNAAVDTHYRFLGCRDGDRLGRYEGDDGHMSLRVQGQLSDVACLIPAETFHKYRYQGRYAEDLILGVRLIKDGLRPAMLANVKIIHSHNRPTGYHLKRTFVDVVFLTEVFPDFPIPHAASAAGAAAAARALEALVEDWRPAVDADAAEELRAFSRRARSLSMDQLEPAPIDFGFKALTPWLEDAIAREKTPGVADAEQLRNMFADRLDHLAEFVGRTYGPLDEYLAGELAQAARKTLAATLGAQLSFLYLSQAKKGDKAKRKRVDDLRTLMTAGI